MLVAACIVGTLIAGCSAPTAAPDVAGLDHVDIDWQNAIVTLTEAGLTYDYGLSCPVAAGEGFMAFHATPNRSARDRMGPGSHLWVAAPDGEWGPVELQPADGTSGLRGTASLAARGELLVVGNTRGDLESWPLSPRGIVQTYVHAEGGWNARATRGEGTEDGDGFGDSVATDGRRFAVGAPRASGAKGLVFVGEPGSGLLRDAITAPDAEDFFGRHLALTPDAVVVIPSLLPGYAYPTGSETPARILEERANQWLPGGVAADGDWLSVAVAYSKPNKVIMFHRTGEGWKQVQELEAPNNRTSFGTSLALLGDTLAVGQTVNPGAVAEWPTAPSGMVHVYTRADGQWRLVRTLTPAEKDWDFGTCVALSGHSLVVGSPSGGIGPGALYVVG